MPSDNKNSQGGFDPESKDQMDRWKMVDLITLPEDVKGTNCSNCKFVDTSGDVPYCKHPEVQDSVTERMCCARWDNDGVERLWAPGKKNKSIMDIRRKYLRK